LAGIDVAHWDFPTRGLSIFVHPGRSRSARCYHHLHQRLLNLFVGGADPCVLRSTARSGRIAALRI